MTLKTTIAKVFVSPEGETKVRHNSETIPRLQFARAGHAYALCMASYECMLRNAYAERE